MTDTRVSQAAPVFLTSGSNVIQVPQIAVYTLTKEQALNVQVSQLAIVVVQREYTIPINLHGFLIRAIWGFPLFIEEGYHD